MKLRKASIKGGFLSGRLLIADQEIIIPEDGIYETDDEEIQALLLACGFDHVEEPRRRPGRPRKTPIEEG